MSTKMKIEKDKSGHTIVWAGYMIKYAVARKNTVWYTNRKSIRDDSLASVSRIYGRKERAYVYRLIIGRLAIWFAKLNGK